MTVTIRSFAKINVGLRIGPLRSDGFHELLTVYQTIGLHDVIRLNVQRGRGIEIRCDDPRVPRDASNTCYRIVDLGTAALRVKGRVVIDIEKRLPVQGGLGGASANAVATLLALERAVRKTLTQAERLRIAADVGSDLPLFLVGGAVLGVGRGEQVYPVADFPTTACVVVTPEVGVSTPKAFAEWDRRQGLKPSSSGDGDAALKGRSSTDASTTFMNSRETAAEPCSAWTGEGARPYMNRGAAGGHPRKNLRTAGAYDDSKLTVTSGSDRIGELGYGLSAWLSEMCPNAPSSFTGRGRAGNPLLGLVRAGIENDFEQVVFPEYPELGEAKRALMRAGAKYASLSGSGSTLYGLFASRAAAVAAVARLRKGGWAAQATVTLPRREYWRRMFGG